MRLPATVTVELPDDPTEHALTASILADALGDEGEHGLDAAQFRSLAQQWARHASADRGEANQVYRLACESAGISADPLPRVAS